MVKSSLLCWVKSGMLYRDPSITIEQQLKDSREEFWYFYEFFAKNELLKKIKYSSLDDIDIDSSMMSDEVTDEGDAFFLKAENSYGARFSRNRFADPSDTTVLARALKKFRSQSAKTP